MGNLFYSIFKSVEQRKRSYALVMLFIFGMLFWNATNITLEEDISKLVPSNAENSQVQNVLNTVNFTDKIIVHIRVENDGNLTDLTNYATVFLDSISTQFENYVASVQGHVEDEDALMTLDFVYNNMPLFLTSEDYEHLDKKLNQDSIKAITEANYKTLISPSGIIAKKTISRDPLGMSFLGLQHLKQLGMTDDFVLREGFLVSKSEQDLLLFITPKQRSSETENNIEFSNRLYQLQNQLNEDFAPKVASSYFGGLLIAVANAQQIKIDIQTTLSIALSILLIGFIIFYRKLSIPIVLFVPTLFGGLLALSMIYFIRTYISAISLGIGAVLIGVTLDYSLHILTHIRNKETTKTIYANVTKPILMSSVTTALAFLCLLFIDSQALQDLGIFAAISVIGSSVFALIFIPQVYLVKDKIINQKKTIIDGIAGYRFSRNKILLAILAIIIAISAFTFHTVNFNKDLSKLNFVPDDLKNVERQLDALNNASSKSLYAIAFGDDMESVLQTNDSIYTSLQSLKKEKTIIAYNSVGALINSKATQQKHINKWNQFWIPEKIQQTQIHLIEEGHIFGFKPTSFVEFYTLLHHDFKILNVDDYKLIPSISTDDFISKNSELITISSLIKVEEDKIEAIKDYFNTFQNTMIIDRQDLNETLLGNLKQDFNTLIRYSFGAVFIILLIFYRSLKLTIVTILPIVLTWFVTLGLMGLFNLEFNIFNIIISTFIFGLGVDYSIFMTNGLIHQEQDNNTLTTHKSSIILSVITTVLGVGVLIFAKHPALHSIALVSIIGICSALCIAFTIQPLLYKFLILKSVKK